MFIKMNMRTEVKNQCLILVGSIALAAGVALFLAPNRIATGGTPGMAILLNYLIDLPIGLLMLMINLPLLALGYRILGRSFAIRSVISITLTSLFVDLFSVWLKLPALSNETLLASLYGGVAIGVGVGLILKGEASAGGTTVIARLVASRSRYRPGQIILFFDLLIIITSGLVFAEIERALWSLISIYVTARCIDMILTGAVSEKIVHITSDQAAILSEQIETKLGRQGTLICGNSLDRQQNKTLIFLSIEASRLAQLRDLIKKHDPQAFMIVFDATELLGRGHG